MRSLAVRVFRIIFDDGGEKRTLNVLSLVIDNRPLPGRRGDVTEMAGLRSPSEGAGLEVRLLHATALERTSPRAQRGHSAGLGHSTRGEPIK